MCFYKRTIKARYKINELIQDTWKIDRTKYTIPIWFDLIRFGRYRDQTLCMFLFCVCLYTKHTKYVTINVIYLVNELIQDTIKISKLYKLDSNWFRFSDVIGMTRFALYYRTWNKVWFSFILKALCNVSIPAHIVPVLTFLFRRMKNGSICMGLKLYVILARYMVELKRAMELSK